MSNPECSVLLNCRLIKDVVVNDFGVITFDLVMLRSDIDNMTIVERKPAREKTWKGGANNQLKIVA